MNSMGNKNFTKIFLIILFALAFSQSQAQTHQDFLDIINGEDILQKKQVRIDSFFSNHISKLNKYEQADCYHDLGSKWYFSKWLNFSEDIDLKNAIKATEKSLALKTSIPEPSNCSINKTLYNLSHFYFVDNAVYDAIDSYLELIQNGESYCTIEEKNKIQAARIGLGLQYQIIGDLYKALDVYQDFLDVYKYSEDLSDSEWEDIILTHLRMAEAYFLLPQNRSTSRIDYHLKRAETYLMENSFPCCHFENRINQLRGNHLLDLEDYEQAVTYHQKVLSGLQNHDSVNLAIVHNSLALSHIELKEYEYALENLKKSISYNNHYADPYNNLGDFYVANGNFKKALENYQTAINLAIDKNTGFEPKEKMRIEDVELSPNKIPLLNHITTKANGWVKYYKHDNNKEHLTHALETFILADELVDLIRFESSEYQSKLFWREQGAALYMKAVEVCHLLHKPAAAFHFMERNKALLLLEDLTNEEAKEISNLPNKAAEREFNLKRAIFLAENNLQEASNESNETIMVLKDSIRKKKYRYEQLVDSLNESYPDYAKFKNKAAVLTFNDLKTNYVSANKAVLHYILNEEQGYGLLTLPDTTLLFQMNDIPKLNKDVETLTATLSNGISDIGMFQKVSNSVFGQLLPENIYDKIKGRQLIIIPDYTLQRIPFEALVVKKAEPKYLIEDLEISYAYSMSLMDYTMGKGKEPPNDLVAFAPVQFDSMGLPQLYFSENEVTSIAEVYPGKTFLNGRASKASFIENIGQYKIVHLATHADVGDGENPWIAFSDSKMYLKEIYATRNQADMVVLSACNTSNGDLKRGEGVMSLARGFFYSGAKSVVSTLWPVADEAGKDILISFYENLYKGDSKSAALHKAKLAYLRNTEEVELKQPYYWAGFIVVGDNAPMVAISYGYWVLLAMGLLVLVFLLFKGKSFKGIQ